MLIGQEYTVIGWCKNRLILQDKGLLQSLLVDICQRISMQPLGSIGVDVPVELERLGKEQFEDEGGSTSSVLAAKANQASLVLSTSHANIHGWPERDNEREDGGFFWFTVGSCRSFEPKTIDHVLDKTLHVTNADRNERWVNLVDDSFFSCASRPI